MSLNMVSGWHQTTSPRRERWITMLIVAAAVVIAVLITLFVFQTYRVDGQSMENTLQNNDRLIILKLPRTWARLTGHPYIPHRGDVIVFNEIGLYGDNSQKQLIKRVIGLPGDRVVISNNTAMVYNQAHPKGFNPDKGSAWENTMASSGTAGNIETTLGKNQLYVMGDNRPDSADSRVFGPIDASQIVGKLNLRILPLGKAQTY